MLRGGKAPEMFIHGVSPSAGMTSLPGFNIAATPTPHHPRSQADHPPSE